MFESSLASYAQSGGVTVAAALWDMPSVLWASMHEHIGRPPGSGYYFRETDQQTTAVAPSAVALEAFWESLWDAYDVAGPRGTGGLDYIKVLRRLSVSVPHESDLREHFEQRPGLALMLVDITVTAARALPRETRLSVESYRDPESGQSDVVLYLRKRDYRDLSVLAEVDELVDAYATRLAAMSDRLHITTDFQPA